MTQRSARRTPAARSGFFFVLGIVAAVALVGFAAIALSGSAAPAATSGGLLSPQQYAAQFGGGAPHFLLDVRTPGEFAGGHIADAANIAVETLAGSLGSVPRDVPVVVYCRSGNRSAQAAQILRQAGYTAVYDLGGIIAWQAAGFPVEP